MKRTVRYLSHPQVEIDPLKPIESWSLNAVGRARVAALASSGALIGTSVVVSSGETKALETAKPIADATGCVLDVRRKMHENDRSATGFLRPDAFEAVADEFFAHPETSVRGWETAIAAQARIVGEVGRCLRDHPESDMLIVGHGGVGTLLFCHLSDLAIDRQYDQGSGGGGCFFEFGDMETAPGTGWRLMEELCV